MHYIVLVAIGIVSGIYDKRPLGPLFWMGTLSYFAGLAVHG